MGVGGESVNVWVWEESTHQSVNGRSRLGKKERDWTQQFTL